MCSRLWWETLRSGKSSVVFSLNTIIKSLELIEKELLITCYLVLYLSPTRKFSNAHPIPVKMGERAQTFKMHTDVHACLVLRVTIVSITSTTAITLPAPRTPTVWMELTNMYAGVTLDFQASVKYHALSS